MQTLQKLCRTPLYSLQQARGGRFVDFAGWEMAVQFAGLVSEHLATRSHAGLFDVSHMGELTVTGPQALAALQLLVTNDVAKLQDGRALYTVMCVQDGGIVDDLIVYREHQDSYFLCVNASRRQADLAHIKLHSSQFDCQVTDVSDAWALLALQGPQAQAIVTALCPSDTTGMRPFAWMFTELRGVPVRLARTGYTGEHGFEIFVQTSAAEALFLALEKVGTSHGMQLCGLGARDTLRLEMKYPLYGNDIDLQHHPLEAGLGWVVKFAKGDFLGRAALLQHKEQGPVRAWVGLKMLGRGIARAGYKIFAQGQQVGCVTSGTHSPSLGKPIACGYVPVALSAPGTPLDILIRDRPVQAQVVNTPFYPPRSL
jgi:aminomethyltransferase